MKNIVKVFYHDFKRIRTNVVAVVVVIGLAIIPSLYAWFNILSNWDPYGPESTSNLKIAVYSSDKGVDIGGMKMNIGDNVVEGLKSNNSMGWQFVDSSDEAVEGVYSSEYYAALIIPEDFSEKMISFLSGEIENPQILYYENEKKNAIAPKITSKAKTAVQEQVNATFVSTLAEVMLKMDDVMAENGMDADTMMGLFMVRLQDLSDDMDDYISLLNSFQGITNSASSLISTTQVMMPNLNNMVDEGSNTINTMQGAISAGSLNASALADVISANLDATADSLDNLELLLQSSLGQLDDYGNISEAGIQSAINMMPLIRQLFDSSVADWKDEESVSGQIDEIEAQFDKIEADLKLVQQNVTAGNDSVNQLNKQISAEIDACQAKIKTLRNEFNYSVRGQLETTMNSIQNSLNQTQAILNGVDGDFDSVSDALDAYSDTLNTGSSSLSDSIAAAQSMKDGLDTIIVSLGALEMSEQYQQLMTILKTDPEMLGEFISSPVNMETKEVYPIKNYGSAMSPFYTVLALWVGALILVAILHVKVLPDDELPDVKPYQKYFGRYITFYLIGQAQALLTALGDLLYIRIQCLNPFLFWFACSVCSFVFTLFMYSLTVAFENIGEALAVVIMVIQVAGAGGSFPIQVLPEIYQKIYKFFPFPYGMDALRETIGGMYGITYWKCIGILGFYIILSLIIGLVLAVPFRRLNEKIEHSKEKSDIML